MKLIGLGGTNGSGKDTVAHMLEERHGWLFISVTDLLREEARNRGLEPSREHLRTISSEWRSESGLGVLVQRAALSYEQASGYNGLVVASLRNPGEADAVHELGGTVVWVDADPKIRYDRIQAHLAERGRGAEDNKTFEQFVAEEQAEMQQAGDATTLNMSAVRDRADMTILNEGTDIEAFKDAAEELLKSYL